ncbi:uncharacterized protein ARMOST_16350 [Armillaria ostoyae]|uniref:Peptidase C14 caspase domain-containing protein n=1 Tax=Armillaria ostoyae TaxID=47428 RepID=A0A284RVY6_ARMOS|nr:uncharacterized protein ARMOST_16350 [Armillaria ostoyae]
MEKYLVEDLGVPRDRIQRLLGPMGQKTADNSISPTRANITRTLYSLIDNPDIMRGYNIIIYFAGNGTLYDAEEYYRNRVPPEVSIASISDREIDPIVTQISQQKGNKITLILDCGYLRPSIRYASPLGTRRSLRIVASLSRHTIEPMLEDTHQRLAAYPQYLARRSVAAYDWRPDRSSHVVLAACEEYQYAREAEDDAGIHGVFTKALVDALRSGQSRGTTYADLISKLPMWHFQTSFVTGDHKNEPIWY